MVIVRAFFFDKQKKRENLSTASPDFATLAVLTPNHTHADLLPAQQITTSTRNTTATHRTARVVAVSPSPDLHAVRDSRHPHRDDAQTFCHAVVPAQCHPRDPGNREGVHS
jgi:hypothetical protein